MGKLYLIEIQQVEIIWHLSEVIFFDSGDNSSGFALPRPLTFLKSQYVDMASEFHYHAYGK